MDCEPLAIKHRLFSVPTDTAVSGRVLTVLARPQKGNENLRPQTPSNEPVDRYTEMLTGLSSMVLAKQPLERLAYSLPLPSSQRLASSTFEKRYPLARPRFFKTVSTNWVGSMVAGS